VRKSRVERVCLYCGTHFTSIPAKIKDGRGKFCSRRCHNLSQVGRAPKGTMAAVYVDRICQQCGRSFKLRASLLKWQTGQYCSRLCGNRAKGNPQDPHKKAALTSKASLAMWANPEHRERMSEVHKQLWQNPEFRMTMLKRTFEAVNAKPNKLEQRIIGICAKHAPDFEWNGDFSLGVMIAGLVPDLVNVDGKKQVIEVLGDYFHSPEIVGERWQGYELGKLMLYNSVGYNCLILWEHDITSMSDDEIAQKVQDFSRTRPI
jgi:hypothetical protein